MAMPLMTNTLPTIIGMGVVSHATDTMFGGRRRSNRSRSNRTYRSASPSASSKSAYSYTVYFRYVDGRGKLRHSHVRVNAGNMTEAKSLAIRGEKPRKIAVDRVKRI